ncbi:MAG: MFS transporter [Verrucomicrobia bacterium]|nr:MFS transporter [Verrucomicrobiota bacterium]
MPDAGPKPAASRWYAGVTGYQWLVLAIASAGWVFDAFEGQLFNITRQQLLADILGPTASAADIKRYGDQLLGVFLAGGAFGGILFGSLADRWGRRPTMVATILMYSVFSGLTYFAQTLGQIAVLRFLVAMGVGGEWSVAAALVSEVFPIKARAHASAIFHSTSIFGTWLAAFAGLWVGAQWRNAFLIGVVPALLVLWVRAGLKEPERWTTLAKKSAPGETPKRGSLLTLLGDPRWSKRAWLGLALAGVGLSTFWGVIVAGQDLAREFLVRHGTDAKVAAEKAKSAYGYLQATGGGLGLLFFGPLAARFGRRRAFVVMHIAALLIVPVVCWLPASYGQLLALLPLYGFLTLSIHAGYAIYFPELFPTHLRATGTGFCFNGGRIVSAGAMIFSGWLKGREGMDLRLAVTLLGLLFLLGLVFIAFLPETKDQPLPE